MTRKLRSVVEAIRIHDVAYSSPKKAKDAVLWSECHHQGVAKVHPRLTCHETTIQCASDGQVAQGRGKHLNMTADKGPSMPSNKTGSSY